MRGALEWAAVRVAPSMNAQEVASIIWGLATLGWQVGEGAMRALERAAVRVAPIMKRRTWRTLSGQQRHSGGRLQRGRCGARWRRLRCGWHRA